ncbi:MAG: hypothetical protein DMG13_27635 [Acidobacteria bacterium]|nr:MAG: hypothetical protein DMG13_27635 [Acidobacteriota bacterium]
MRSFAHLNPFAWESLNCSGGLIFLRLRAVAQPQKNRAPLQSEQSQSFRITKPHFLVFATN